MKKASNPMAAFDRVSPMTKNLISKQANAVLKSWVKVFAAAAIACYLAGSRDLNAIANAGLAALLPVIYTWFDPTDKRYGRKK